MRRKTTQIYSIFGQIEEAAANYMIEKGEATKIESKDIPGVELLDKQGRTAKFAVIVPGDKIDRFEEVIANLRA